ncbi:Protein SGT1 like protein [Dictyocoela muelleri]|nr:Protein SGT1 like protein [Dictyocoela muelleri]
MRYDWYETKDKMIIVVYTKEPIEVNLDYKKLIIKNENDVKEINLYDKVSNMLISEYSCKKEIILQKSILKKWDCLEKDKCYKNDEIFDRNYERIEVSDENKNVISFFKDIYSKSNDDVKRAMNKSFLESKGKVLNTKWTEVDDKNKEKY